MICIAFYVHRFWLNEKLNTARLLDGYVLQAGYET